MTTFIGKTDSEKYPFGKTNLEPILVLVKSLVLLIMCTVTMTNAVKAVLSGGNKVEVGFAIGYAIISSVGCAIVYFYMKSCSKTLNSEIIKAESNQWLMDTILSVGVFVGFIISLVLGKLGLYKIANYVDPVMVILTSSIFLRVPIITFINSFKEIINVTADKEINEDVSALVKEIEKEYNMEDSISRVVKVGRELRIEIDFVVSNNSKVKSVEDMDKVREIIDKNTNHFDLKKWLNVSFTKNKKWAI
ncbi:hypothetical protein JCM1393_23690 [Clostridium carnis]